MSRGNATLGTDDVTPILLAAGAGRRFRDVGHKLVAILPEQGSRPPSTVFERSLAALLDADIGSPVIVTGRLDAHDLGIADRDDVTVSHNDGWERGQMTSVQRGLAAATSMGSGAVVIGLADQPGIEPDAWRAVAAAIHGESPIAVATYRGRRANPVGLRREVWHLLADSGDEGARGLMRLRPDLVVEVPCTGSPNDIDTVEDLTRWQSN